MSKQPLPDLSSLDILDNDDLFTIQTPGATSQTQTPQASSSSVHGSAQQASQAQSKAKSTNAEPYIDDATSRENALRAELASLKRINQVVEGLRASLEKAKANMETLNTTTSHATHLLQTWTRILSQTEHNQRLILNPAWQGASQDLADAEGEVARRAARERERAVAEEARRKRVEEERARRAEEEERRREEGARTPGKRGRGATRGSFVGASTRGVERSASSAGSRAAGRAAAMQYGRVGSVGTKPARGRGRGVG